MKNYNYYLEEVKKNGEILQFAPKKIITTELCQAAIQQNGWAIRYVPEEFLTQDLYKIAVKQDPFILELVPEQFKTMELCEMAVKANIRVFFHAPKKIQKDLKKIIQPPPRRSSKSYRFKTEAIEALQKLAKEEGKSLTKFLESLIMEKAAKIKNK